MSSQNTATIIAYMKRQQRPYSVIQLYDNLKQEIPKSQIQKILESISSEDVDGDSAVVSKTFGKATIYFCRQRKEDEMNEEETKKLDKEIASLRDDVSSLKKRFLSLSEELTQIQSTPADSQLESEIKASAQKVSQLESQMAAIRQSQKSASPISAADFESAQREFNALFTEWKRRRRGCLDICGAILENLSMKADKFYSDRGMEMDPKGKAIQDFQLLFKALPKQTIQTIQKGTKKTEAKAKESAKPKEGAKEEKKDKERDKSKKRKIEDSGDENGFDGNGNEETEEQKDVDENEETTKSAKKKKTETPKKTKKK